MFKDVAQFHYQVLGLVAPARPERLNRDLTWERYKFLHEELNEFADADSFTKEVDALLDMVYVALGTLHMMGVDADLVWKFVQEANMKKVKGTTHRGNKIDAAKPEGWVGPEAQIAKYLNENQP